MVDVKHLKNHPDLYRESAKRRGVSVDIGRIADIDSDRIKQAAEVDTLRAALNVSGKPSAEQLIQLQETKRKLAKEEEELGKILAELNALMAQVPNLLAEGTPDGGEAEAAEERRWGEAKSHPALQDHLSLAEAKGWLDFERGGKVAGSKFYFLKGPLVKLELAILRLALDLAEEAGFIPMQVPHMVNSRVAAGTGFNPKGPEEQIYSIEGEDLHLIATAELPLTGLHADEVLENLPYKYAGASPSYRKESGAYGKHSKGLYRVHQFNKLELYILCDPVQSADMLQQLVELEEKITQALAIPYRVTRTAAGDLGAPHFQKYDLEYWSPVEGAYRELTSASNCTDYQARSLNIRYRTPEGKLEYVHTLNATAVAMSRAVLAILENHQTENGEIKLPAQIAKYYGRDEL